MNRLPFVCLALAVSIGLPPISALAADLTPALAKVRSVAPVGEGHADALVAVKSLSQASPSELPQILAAMDGANPIATNWLRACAEAVADRAVAAGKLPAADLERFLQNQKHSPRARRLAYELIAKVDPLAETRLIPPLLDDRSLELRRDAVALVIAQAGKVEDKAQSLAAYQKAFGHARDLDQIKELAEKLKTLGQPPDTAAHLGFVTSWHVIGPFDNVDDKGWDVAYPPETKLDLAAEHNGQKGKVKWTSHTTADDYGQVDLNKLLGKHKGAIAYVAAEFVSSREQPCELRLGSTNANKVWLNGEPATANHVYHANVMIDQYTARGRLKAGQNTILLKISQNEQTEPWAQDWSFQLRVCDEIGTAILSENRPAKEASVSVRE